MEEARTLQVIVVSGACCMKHLARLDEELERNILQASAQVAIAVQVRKVSLSALLSGGESLSPQQRRQVLSLFHKYGARFAPALLIGDQLRFAGSVPTIEQLREALAAAG